MDDKLCETFSCYFCWVATDAASLLLLARLFWESSTEEEKELGALLAASSSIVSVEEALDTDGGEEEDGALSRGASAAGRVSSSPALSSLVLSTDIGSGDEDLEEEEEDGRVAAEAEAEAEAEAAFATAAMEEEEEDLHMWEGRATKEGRFPTAEGGALGQQAFSGASKQGLASEVLEIQKTTSVSRKEKDSKFKLSLPFDWLPYAGWPCWGLEHVDVDDAATGV